ncbi:MAG: helix-turn-helix transcriptional regulator [Ruminiclostridium sp.]|nr:helix-turn-helix transcriptional regulator [Ruminiclostridium sp.]
MASKATRSTYTPEKENAVFATRLRNLFKENSKTHTDLADYITKEAGESVTRQAVGQWCNGTTCPNIKTVPIIAKYFKVSTDYLFGLSDYKTSDIEKSYIAKYMHISPDTIDKMHVNVINAVGNTLEDQNGIYFVFDKIISSYAFWDIVCSCWNIDMLSHLKYSHGKQYTELNVEDIYKIADKLEVLPGDIHSFIANKSKKIVDVLSGEREIDAKCNMFRYENFKDIERISNLFDFREHFSECSIDELCEILGIDKSTLNDLRTKKAGE